VLTLAACQGGGASAAPVICNAAAPSAAVVTSSLVQPAAGAVGVSTTIGTVVATADAGLTGTRIELVSADSAIFGGPFVTASSSTVSATIPPLGPHTTYTVFFVIPSGTQQPAGPCPPLSLPFAVESSIGSFTTQ
jgi:hypothetical protein